MKSAIYFSFLLFSFLFVSCSSTKTSKSFSKASSLSSNEYMPLDVGNKWYYNFFTLEVIGVETIEGKDYYKLEFVNNNPQFPSSIFYQRISNDTLYTLTIDEKDCIYYEKVDAIFSLEEDEESRIKRKIENNERLRELPPFSIYSIKVTYKDENTIKFNNGRGVIDGDTKKTYKKGIGLVKAVSGWGIVTELIDYDLK